MNSVGGTDKDGGGTREMVSHCRHGSQRTNIIAVESANSGTGGDD